ncbi:Uncharacterized protein TCM_035219 isoform 1 [Theobroma cacao]|uniref:Uncharacterized protein isoform 1 n=1 Tax=Theobroma cacao TaxID=3641 RepID=A0A061FHA0_THECC|nr:Uncharacterized protein TCM_035219 isoform 1 [Theobroma cacao]
MGGVENHISDDILEDLRFYSRLKKERGMLENFRPSCGSNGKRNKKIMNKQCNEIDMEESIKDSDYETFISSLEQYGYGHDHDHDREKGKERDPQYEMFLENLKPDGTSYLAEIPLSSGLSIIIRYEEKEQESFENVERMRNFKSNSKRVKAEVPDYLDGFSRKAKTDLRRIKANVPENSGGFSRKAKAETTKTVKKDLKIGEKKRKEKARDVPNGERKSAVDENQVKEEAEDDSVPHRSSGEPSKKMSLDMVDESWEEFLNSRSKRDEKMVFSDESGHDGRHWKDDESSSDVEILASDNIPFHEGGYTPFVPAKSYQSLTGDESWEGIKNFSLSQFREKLMNLLKKPYDQEEFDYLWREVTYKKPVQGVRDLRNGRMKAYSTKTDGKSYLDWYKKLKMKIDEFRCDRHKILCLLRGFFFWLENTAHEGSFQPWLDSLYLNALDDRRFSLN